MTKVLVRLFILCAAACLLLTGCGDKNTETKTPEPSDITAQILSELTFSDEMLEVSDSILEKQYKLDMTKVESASVYVVGSGALADEVAVVRAKSADDVEAIKTALQGRADKLMDNFVDYVPDEVPKIEDAHIVVKGNYLLLAVHSEADRAQEIFEASF